MGFGVHEIQALELLNRLNGPLGKVATFGRQSIVGEYTAASGKIYSGYCEHLLIEEYGASSVDSYDFNDYEGATCIHDLGRELLVEQRYDTVIDGGTSEHIFNIGQSLINAGRLSKIGGNILHFLPANSFCGHGMYQVSPELFYSLYSSANGFSAKVFLAKYYGINRYKYWYYVERPVNGNRIEFSSKTALGVIVFSKKEKEISNLSVYQSDYVDAWGISDRSYEGDSFSKKLKSLCKFLAANLGLLDPIIKFKMTINSYVNVRPYYRHPKISRVKVELLFSNKS